MRVGTVGDPKGNGRGHEEEMGRAGQSRGEVGEEEFENTIVEEEGAMEEVQIRGSQQHITITQHFLVRHYHGFTPSLTIS